jgi:hypothetical protein
METKIGINIICNTAREQDLFIGVKESRQYYENEFEHSILMAVTTIIKKYIDCMFEVRTNTNYQKDGSCLNAIEFTFYNKTGFNKTELRKELNEYISNHFKKLFEHYETKN